MNDEDTSVQLNEAHCAQSSVDGGTGRYDASRGAGEGGRTGGKLGGSREQQSIRDEEANDREAGMGGEEEEMEMAEAENGGPSYGIDLDASRQQPLPSRPRGASSLSAPPALSSALLLPRHSKEPTTSLPLESGRLDGGVGGQALQKGGGGDRREDEHEGGAGRVKRGAEAAPRTGKRSEEGLVRRFLSFSFLFEPRSDSFVSLSQHAVKVEVGHHAHPHSSTLPRSLPSSEHADVNTAQDSRRLKSRETTSSIGGAFDLLGGDIRGDGTEERAGGGGGKREDAAVQVRSYLTFFQLHLY